jgi:hypothetical protein
VFDPIDARVLSWRLTGSWRRVGFHVDKQLQATAYQGGHMLDLKTVSLALLLAGIAAGPLHSAPASGASAPKPSAKRQASPSSPHIAPAKRTASAVPDTPQQSASKNPDIELVLVVRAKELRYDTVPHVKVNFSSTQGSINSDVTDRVNLPKKLEAGVTYKDVGFTWHVSTSLEEIAKIAGDVLGQTVRPSGPGDPAANTPSSGKGAGRSGPSAESAVGSAPSADGTGTGDGGGAPIAGDGDAAAPTPGR